MTDTPSPTLLSPGQYIEALGRDGSAMHELLVRDPGCLSTPVPSCPGWNVGKLINHLGRVFCSVREHVVRRATEMVPADEISFPPEGEAIVPWFEEVHASVLEAVSEIDPQESLWSWAGQDQGNGAFYQRRMAHEVLIHRWDLEVALGEPARLPAELALDNVDELLQVVLPFTIANWERQIPQGSLHLHSTEPSHATDSPPASGASAGEWLVTPDSSGSYSVAYEHAKGDVAVRGTAEALALFVWERIPLSALQEEGKVDVFGDFQLAELWAQLSR